MSAYSFRALAWKPYSRTFVCLRCQEDEGERYPLETTLAGLVWGFKTFDINRREAYIPNINVEAWLVNETLSTCFFVCFCLYLLFFLGRIVLSLSSVPEDQMHENTSNNETIIDSDEEMLE
jgi:hypothetical protein